MSKWKKLYAPCMSLLSIFKDTPMEKSILTNHFVYEKWEGKFKEKKIVKIFSLFYGFSKKKDI